MSDDFKTPEMYRRELSRMEAAMSAQMAWLKDWHIAVLAPDPNVPPPSIGPSPFRGWYYGLPSDLYAESMAFAALGLNLETMQSLAEQLANAVRAGGKLPAADYAAFMESVVKFNDLVFKLIREAVSEIAFIDDLTGVGNESGMKLQIAAELERVRRTDQRICVALVEISEFRLAGDDEGDAGYHLNPAEVMSQFAALLNSKLRPYDQLFRTGEDLFMLSLPYTETDVAEAVLKRLSASLTGGKLMLIDETEVDLTIRFGIASIEPDDKVETVVEHAHAALAATKEPRAGNIATYRRY